MKLERCIIISALLACVATAGASAATCAVDPVNGVDSPGAAAYKTLTYALAQHGGGTTYSLAAGTYSAATGEMFPITLCGLSDVTFDGGNGPKAVFDAAGANTRVFVVTSACDRIAFSNVKVTGAAVVYNSTVTGQSTGAVTLKDSTNISFTDCEVSGNTAKKTSGNNTVVFGAGMSIFSCVDVTFDRCAISHNTMLDNNWGSMYGAGVGLASSKNVQFSNTEFVGNGSEAALGNFIGAAVHAYAYSNSTLGFPVLFSNCLFRANSSATMVTGAQDAYGSQAGSCIALTYDKYGYPTAEIKNCTFLENAGEAIKNNKSQATATDCVFVGNTMPDVGTVTYTRCLWESFDVSAGYHPASGDDPARTPAVDWYVSPEGSDSNTGLDAAHPFRTLTKAFSVLTNNATVHVSDGAYDAAGGETFPLALNRVLDVTIEGGDGIPVINAGRAGRVLDAFGCHGLTIRKIAITGANTTSGYGGGARLRACRATFESCCVTNNLISTTWANGDTLGGGIYACGLSSSIVLDNTVVADNDIGSTGGKQGKGGGVAVVKIASLVVTNCVFRNNGSTSAYMANGGGLYVSTSSKFLVFNTLLTGNRSTGAGAVVYTTSAGTMVNCTVADNLVSVPLAGTGALTLRDSICYGNAAEPASTVTLDHTLTTSPGFVGDTYLVGPDSDAIDYGSVTVESVGLGEPMTIRADGAYDTGVVDAGYHQVSTGPVVAITDLYVSPSGSDSNDGLDAAHPLGTITKALSLVQNGTTVHIAAGTYGVATGESFPLTLAKSRISLVCENGVALVDAAGGGDCALAVSGAQDFTLRRVVFANARRVGEFGGGLDIRNSSGVIDSCVVSNCVVSHDNPNGTTTYGGGLYVTYSSLTMTNCSIVANGTEFIRGFNTRLFGGGLYVAAGSSVELAACSIAGNFTTASYGVYGVAVCMQNGSSNVPRVTMRNCLVTGNRRKDGTAAKSTISAPYGTLTVENCTIVDNLANMGAVGNLGEGVSNKATVSIVNSILADNARETNGTISVSHTLIRNGDADAVNHVITGDPMFKDQAMGDYRLCGNSPCVNSGINAAWMRGAVDFTGGKRIHGGGVDMGCHEYSAGGTTILLR